MSELKLPTTFEEITRNSPLPYIDLSNSDLESSLQFETYIRSKFVGLGKFTQLGTEDNPILKDNANEKLPAQYQLITDDVEEAIKTAYELNMGIMMVGALTSATKNFTPQGLNAKNLNGIIAIQAAGIEANKTLNDYQTANERVLSNEIKLDRDAFGPDQHSITMGPGLTFSQVNNFLKETLGHEYFIPVDLTTIDQAHAGAVYATGAQGPSRIKTSQILSEVKLHNGEKEITLSTPEEIQKHEGLIGLTGAVTSMTLRVVKRPPNRFGITLPIQDAQTDNWSEKTAPFLAKFQGLTNIKIENGKIVSQNPAGYIDGIEILSAEGLKLVANNPSFPEPEKRRATELLKQIEASKSSMMLYITGNNTQDLNVDMDRCTEEIFTALEDLSSKKLLNLDLVSICQGSNNLEQMRIVRELIPDAARTSGYNSGLNQLSFSTSTDVNSKLEQEFLNSNPEEIISETYAKILAAYQEYELSINHIAQEQMYTQITMERYGHLNPQGIDPHFRATAKVNFNTENGMENEAISAEFENAKQAITMLRGNLMKKISRLMTTDSGIKVTHGEKGQIAGYQFLSPLQQAEVGATIAQSNHNFNFRTPKNIQTPAQV